MQSIGPYADMWQGSVCGEPEGYGQGEVRHPSAACGGTSPYRGGFSGLRRGRRGRPLAAGCSCAGEIWRCAALCNDARLLRRA